MKYPVELYAKSFIEVVSATSQEKRDKIISNFLKIIRKNGDYLRIKKIFTAIREAEVKKRGGRIINLELAREIPENLITHLKSYFSKKDYISISVRPDLIAGLRILIDNEKELDTTMKRKLKKIFK